ncbi:MAG: bifunctional 2-C-methyl-D-erythritol 4-phosphate cytidylyltransferase/2-C-methyl-D-erythritol 2,4-cyclodiphosphate synthase [Beijerinckiaceae bacterium]
MTETAGKSPPKVAALIVAAGRGSRFGGDLPKQYAPLAGRTILARTLAAFSEHPSTDAVQIVIHADDRAAYAAATEATTTKLLRPAIGGATRQASVLAGLEALAEAAPDVVLIHDAARPFVSTALIDAAIAAARAHGAAVPGAVVTDTIVGVSDGTIAATPERASLRAVQTPQAFRFDLILAAHRRAAAESRHDFTDDGNVARFAGHAVHVFEGDPANVKITTQGDLLKANQRLGHAMISRTGQGFDVHAFGPGDHVMLCGVKVPHTHGFIAHSDGDVALHALTDALLAAMADGDIGRHFPPSDPQWRGASSDRFLAFAAERLRARGGMIDLLDVTMMCEAPKIGPHAEAMRARVAQITGVGVSHVSVKATTTERLGFTGRKEGIAALASVTVRLPETELG